MVTQILYALLDETRREAKRALDRAGFGPVESRFRIVTEMLEARLRVSRRAFGSSGERIGKQMIASVHGTVNGLVLVGLGEGVLLGIAYAVAGVPHPTSAAAPFEEWFSGPEGPQALFAGRVLSFDEKAALIWARLMAEGRRTGKPRSALDTIIAATAEPVRHEGVRFTPGRGYWKTNEAGIVRLKGAGRIGAPTEKSISYVRYFGDFPMTPITDIWLDTQTGAFTDEKVYAVQTGTKVIERCMLMTTDPEDLVVDPTCGSGTTAYVAEQWGRRWIAVDTSRVAIAIARQRLITAKFDYYRLKDEVKGLSSGFVYKTAPHIALRSIAQNTALDAIFAKHDHILDARLADLNAALAVIGSNQRGHLAGKLLAKQRAEGKRSITEADCRRWILPDPADGFQHWTVPFDTDPDHSEDLSKAITAYRAAWRAKQNEVGKAITYAAEPEELVDQPEKVPDVTRVSGPFTVEAVQPAETSPCQPDRRRTGGVGRYVCRECPGHPVNRTAERGRLSRPDAAPAAVVDQVIVDPDARLSFGIEVNARNGDALLLRTVTYRHYFIPRNKVV